MPVWVSTDTSIDLNKSGDRRRHINPDCPLYLEVPTKDRTPAKGRPNTTKLQDVTVRCEDPKCWETWEREQQGKKSRGAKKTSAKGAATTPTVQKGGKAATLAEKAKAARQKQPAGAAA